MQTDGSELQEDVLPPSNVIKDTSAFFADVENDLDLPPPVSLDARPSLRGNFSIIQEMGLFYGLDVTFNAGGVFVLCYEGLIMSASIL